MRPRTLAVASVALALGVWLWEDPGGFVFVLGGLTAFTLVLYGACCMVLDDRWPWDWRK